ncbi:MAG: hypothetical protein ACRD6N_18515, partial [Pyrinomonadaceae bacterium]
MPDDEERLTSGANESADDEIPEEEIDLNLIETFPASDSPSWTLGHEPHKKAASEATEQSSADDPPR